MSVEANEIHRYPCASCGADLVFEPHDGFLTCPYCGHKEAIPESSELVEEQSYQQHFWIRPEQMEKLADNALEVQCQSCGAKSIFMPPQVAGRCEFCGVQIVAQPKSADPILTPGGVLPFSITQQQASSSLRQWLSSRWFAPNNLKRFAEPEAIHGIYLPFWTYDTNTTTDYTGQRGEYYYVTETYYDRDAQGRRSVVVGRRRLWEVANALAGRPLRPGVLHRRQQLAHEPRRHVHARHDHAGDLALADLVVDPRERHRELVVRERDVREVGVDAAQVLRIHVDVQLALPGIVHAATILRGS